MSRAAIMHDFNLPTFTAHGTSLMAIFIAWLGVLSPLMAFLATLAALMYYLVAIYSSPAIQTWLHSRRIRKLARLKKETARVEAALMVSDNKPTH